MCGAFLCVISVCGGPQAQAQAQKQDNNEAAIEAMTRSKH